MTIIKPPFKIVATYTKESLESYVFKNKVLKGNLKKLLRCFLLSYTTFKDLNNLETIFFNYDYSILIIKNVYNFIYDNETQELLRFPVIFNLSNNITFNKCIQLLNYYLNYFDYTLIKYYKIIEKRGLRSVYKVTSINSIMKEYPFKRFNFDGCYFQKGTITNLVVIREKVYFQTSRNNKIIIDFKK